MTSVGVMASSVVSSTCTPVLREPFDNLTAWSATGASIAAGRTGTAMSMAGTSSNDYILPAGLVNSPYATLGFAYKVSDVGTALRSIVTLRDYTGGATFNLGNDLVTLNVELDGSLRLRDGAAASLGLSAAGLIVAATWYYIEVQMFFADAGGTFAVRLNGTTVISGGGDTRSPVTWTGGVGHILLRGAGSGQNCQFDDLYLTTGAGCAFQGSQTIVGPCTPVLREPFDNLAAWTVAGTSSIVTGRTGTALNCTGATDAGYYSLAANASATVTVGFAWRTNTTNAAAREVCQLWGDSNATRHVRLVYNGTTAQTLTVFRDVVTLGTSSTGLIPVNTWAYIEMQVLLHATLGSVTVRVNGTAVITLTNVNTSNGGTVPKFDTVRLTTAVSGLTNLWDDLYLTVGSGCAFQGDQVIGTPPPQGSLVLAKALTGGPGGYTGPFTINYSGASSGSASVSAGSSQTVTGLATGGVYTASETVPSPPAGYTFGTPTFSPSASVTLPAPDGSSVTVTTNNTLTRDTGSLQITKSLSNPDGATAPSFTINYDCGGGITGQVTLAAGASQTISGIPTGSTCTVTEVAPTAITGFTWGTPTYTPASVSIATKGGTFGITVGNSITRDPVVPPPGVFTTTGYRVFNPSGVEFKPKGVNGGTDMVFYNPPTNAFTQGGALMVTQAGNVQDHSADMLTYGLNMVRVNLQSGVSPSVAIPRLQALIDSYTSKKIVVVIDPHDDFGGNPNFSTWLASWPPGILGPILDANKTNPYVWMEPTNEEYQNSLDPTGWLNYHIGFYNWVRTTHTAPTTMIVADALNYGQDLSYTSTYASLISGRTNQVIAWHNYGGNSQTSDGVYHVVTDAIRTSWMNAAQAAGIPVQIQEFGQAWDPADHADHGYPGSNANERAGVAWIMANWNTYSGMGGLCWHGTGAADNFNIRQHTSNGDFRGAWYDTGYALSDWGTTFFGKAGSAPG